MAGRDNSQIDCSGDGLLGKEHTWEECIGSPTKRVQRCSLCGLIRQEDAIVFAIWLKRMNKLWIRMSPWARKRITPKGLRDDRSVQKRILLGI